MASCQKLNNEKFSKFITEKFTYVDKKENLWSVKVDKDGKIKPYEIIDYVKSGEKGYYYEHNPKLSWEAIKIKNPKTFAKQFCDNYD